MRNRPHMKSGFARFGALPGFGRQAAANIVGQYNVSQISGHFYSSYSYFIFMSRRAKSQYFCQKIHVFCQFYDNSNNPV